ncbi:MAG: hypothetical protein AAB451_01485 [Patescibacteria group bacterium]
MANKNITIDALARMVQKEFSEVNQKLIKLDRMDRNIDRLDKNDQIIIKRLEGIVYRTEFEKLEIRVIELENLLAVNAKRG